jgi:putative transposon-encoded protein
MAMEGWEDTAIVTDHVTGGEIFYERRVTAFGTDEIDLEIRTEGFRDL